MSDETLNPAGTVPSGDPVTHPKTDGDLSDVEQTGKDRSYSPSSAQETEQLQNTTDSAALDDDDIDADDVNLLPGTGGPDDVGDIDVDPDEIDLSGNSGPRPAPSA
ncbi:MAG: hypothetical protein ABWX65_06075 [Mycetocola sp.]